MLRQIFNLKTLKELQNFSSQMKTVIFVWFILYFHRYNNNKK